MMTIILIGTIGLLIYVAYKFEKRRNKHHTEYTTRREIMRKRGKK